jgi:hypothetical protein
MPTREPRNLTHRWQPSHLSGSRSEPIARTSADDPSSATVLCPSDGAPILWQVGVCDDCLTDCVMRRFSEKHQRTVALCKEMNAAADEIVMLRNNVWRTKLAPAELRVEDLRIREKHGAGRHAAARR